MLYISPDLGKKLDKIKQEGYYILTDFDKTLTKENSRTVWESVLLSMSEAYRRQSEQINEKYFALERSWGLNKKYPRQEFVRNWWAENLELIIKNKSSKASLKDAVYKNDYIFFREGFKQFITKVQAKNIPIVILSGAITDMIEHSLKRDKINLNNIEIISNKFKFDDDGNVAGLSNNLVYAMNKSEKMFGKDLKQKLKNYPHAILLGDNITDSLILNKRNSKNAVKICFFHGKETALDEFKTHYDIICEKSANFKQLTDFLKKQYDFEF